jgi:hypothetical protein
MFVVTEADATAIRDDVFEREGELSAAIEFAPTVSGHRRQCQGTGLRPDHRWLATAATEARDAARGQATAHV